MDKERSLIPASIVCMGKTMKNIVFRYLIFWSLAEQSNYYFLQGAQLIPMH